MTIPIMAPMVDGDVGHGVVRTGVVEGVEEDVEKATASLPVLGKAPSGDLVRTVGIEIISVVVGRPMKSTTSWPWTARQQRRDHQRLYDVEPCPGGRRRSGELTGEKN